MNRRVASSLLVAVLATAPAAAQQAATPIAPLAARYTDQVNGLTLDQAIARALEDEPLLQATRTRIDEAEGLRLQAGLRPNPSASLERREEPGGRDTLTTVMVDWPLDLFRRGARVAVAEREIAATRLAVADHERLLTFEVRSRYGDVLAALRELAIFDELVAVTRRQHELLRSRAEEGATAPLERNLVEVELRRLESERLLQAGRTEAALIDLKRVLGMASDAPLALQETLEGVVERESSSTSDEVARGLTAVQLRPDVREAEARVEFAEAKTEEARREGQVEVGLFGSYMAMDAGFPQRAFNDAGVLEPVGARFNYLSAGVRVTLPLFDRNQGAIAAARAERAGAAATHAAVRLTAEAEVAAALAREEHARQAVRLFVGGGRDLARQNLSVVAQSYELGRVTVFEVLAEQRRFLDLERSFTEALRAAFEARTALTRALGDQP